jgi:DNA-binding SARP family transcriptional activator
MPDWTLRLLGEPTIESGRGRRALRLARKGEALLLFVAAHGDAGVSRGRLLPLLWDGHRPDDARNALRQCLHQVRLDLGDAATILASDGDRVVVPDASCAVDVRLFEAQALGADERALRSAAAWYRGDLAEDVDAGAEFGQWAELERQRLRQLAHRVVERLSELPLDADALDEALRLARRLIASDPLHEGTCRSAMRLYARAGLRSQAIQAWTDCRRALRDELGVEPSPATTELSASLLSGAAAPRHGETRPGQVPWWPDSATPPSSPLRSVGDPEVLDLMLHGWELFSRYTAAGHAQARAVYERVIERAPRHPEALTLLGWTHWFDSICGWSADPDASFAVAVELAERALDSGGGMSAPPHGLMGKVLLWQMRHREAIEHLQRAVALAPGYAYMHFHLGDAMMWCGRTGEALEHLERALRLDPNDHGVFLTVRGKAQWMAGEAGAARATLESALRRNPSYAWAHAALAVLHHEAGEPERARAAARAAREHNPRLGVRFAERVMPYFVDEHRRRVADAWRAAGIEDLERTNPVPA